MNLKKIKSIVATYVVFAVPAVLVAVKSGVTNPKTLVEVAVAAILAPVARGLNPKDSAYGIVKVVNDKVQAQAAKDVVDNKK